MKSLHWKWLILFTLLAVGVVFMHGVNTILAEWLPIFGSILVTMGTFVLLRNLHKRTPEAEFIPPVLLCLLGVGVGQQNVWAFAAIAAVILWSQRATQKSAPTRD
jgi:hypothetical protein